MNQIKTAIAQLKQLKSEERQFLKKGKILWQGLHRFDKNFFLCVITSFYKWKN
jgi:hypothetical protein